MGHRDSETLDTAVLYAVDMQMCEIDGRCTPHVIAVRRTPTTVRASPVRKQTATDRLSPPRAVPIAPRRPRVDLMVGEKKAISCGIFGYPFPDARVTAGTGCNAVGPRGGLPTQTSGL